MEMLSKLAGGGKKKNKKTKYFTVLKVCLVKPKRYSAFVSSGPTSAPLLFHSAGMRESFVILDYLIIYNHFAHKESADSVQPLMENEQNTSNQELISKTDQNTTALETALASHLIVFHRQTQATQPVHIDSWSL